MTCCLNFIVYLIKVPRTEMFAIVCNSSVIWQSFCLLKIFLFSEFLDAEAIFFWCREVVGLAEWATVAHLEMHFGNCQGRYTFSHCNLLMLHHCHLSCSDTGLFWVVILFHRHCFCMDVGCGITLINFPSTSSELESAAPTVGLILPIRGLFK